MGDQRERYTEPDRLLAPTRAGRRLDVGGFILADPFELILRQLSESYLRDAWRRLQAALDGHRVTPPSGCAWSST